MDSVAVGMDAMIPPKVLHDSCSFILSSVSFFFFISILDFNGKASRTLVFGHTNKKLQMVPQLFGAAYFVAYGCYLIKQGVQKNFISTLKYVILGSITKCISSLQSILKVLY